MSSIQEQSAKLTDRRPFVRATSLEKIRCSAYYSLQLAGSILSKETLMQLLAVLMIKARNFLQKALIILSFPALKMGSAMVLLWIDAFTKFTGMDVVFEKKIASGPNIEPEKTYTLKVQKKKSLRSSKKACLCSSPTDGDNKTTHTESEQDEEHSGTRTPSPEPLPTVPEIEKPEELHPLLKERLSMSNLSKSNSERSLLTDSNTSLSGRHNFGLVVIVYGCATLVYLQLMFLAAFLHTASTPPGLVFLVSSLGYIGYIVYKICFVKRKSKDDQTLATSSTKSTSISPDGTQTRHRSSRSTTRRFFDFHNKTLSKIKLL